MPDYKESAVAGTRWNRFSRVVVDNPRNGYPSVICVEEEVINLGDAEVRRDVGNLSFAFDPSAVFPIINPITAEPTGETATGMQVYTLLYSVVMDAANKRDNPPAAEPATEPAEEAAHAE